MSISSEFEHEPIQPSDANLVSHEDAEILSEYQLPKQSHLQKKEQYRLIAKDYLDGRIDYQTYAMRKAEVLEGISSPEVQILNDPIEELKE